MATQIDIHEDVTNRILAEMEKGRIPWVKDWTCAGGIISRVSKKPYSGINQLILGMAGVCYGSQQWLTFKQAKALGGSVRKGEKGTRIIFYKKRIIKDDT
ncbi:ArdC-like ssDNA-binding domain-containing protein, partial [Maritalea sp.]|uniref:ArdC-like ssDNA-binding domain-containing protein n=1 Tax=Maritalea sp. TaxID=2003361 RepID=UPI003EF59CA3